MDLWVSAVLAIVNSAALILVVQKSLQLSALHSLGCRHTEGFFFKKQYSHLLIFIRIIVHTGSIIIKEKVLGIIIQYCKDDQTRMGLKVTIFKNQPKSTSSNQKTLLTRIEINLWC